MQEHLKVAEEMRGLAVHVFEMIELRARAASLPEWSAQVHAAAAAAKTPEAAEKPREETQKAKEQLA